MNRLKRLRAASSSGSKDREPRRQLGNPLSVSTSSLNSLKKEESFPNGRTQRSTDDIANNNNNNNEEPSLPITPTAAEKVECQMKESHSLPLRSQICAKCGSASSLQSIGQMSSTSKLTIDSVSLEIGSLPRHRTAMRSREACNACSKATNSTADVENKGATGRTRSLKWNKGMMFYEKGLSIFWTFDDYIFNLWAYARIMEAKCFSCSNSILMFR